MKTKLITDSQRLAGASRNGSAIPIYDDGFGPLWILRDSMGIVGIVRTQTWEDAYSIAEDEMFPDCDETLEELVKEYGEEEAWMDNPLFTEAYGFRPNGLRHAQKPMSWIYSKDLNGESLDKLTPELATELGITIETEEE